jgi:hypothetical protein
MSSVSLAHLVLLLLALAVAMLVFLLARRALSDLLSRTVAVPGGVVFYERAFLMLLIFGAAGSALGYNLDVKPGEHFMEYVWQVASGLGDVLGYIFGTLAIYLVLMTVLVATLKPKNDK